jgi:PKD repeat protein
VLVVLAGGGGGQVTRTPAAPDVAPLEVVALAYPTEGVAPLDVEFLAVASGGEGEPSFSWAFGDGSPDETDAAPAHRFTDPGRYVVVATGPTRPAPARAPRCRSS